MTTTAVPTGPVEVNIVWTCEEVEGRPDGYSCTNLDETDRFRQGYWNVQFTFDHDEDGELVALSGLGGGYNGFCIWGNDEGASFSAPIVDGMATFQHQLEGSDLCVGEVFTFEGTWNHADASFTMVGTIEAG